MRTFLTCFVAHLGGAGIAWLVITDQRSAVWSNRDFGQWIGVALALAVAIPVVVAARGGSRPSLGAAVTGTLAAVLLGCGLFVGWAVLQSA